MHFILKIKTRNSDGKDAVTNYLTEAENFMDAETIANELFAGVEGFLGIDNIVKQNIKKIFLDDQFEFFWAVKVEFAFVEAKAVKEVFIVQGRKIDWALDFINDSINDTEIAMATVLEVKKVEIKDAYTRTRLEEEMNIISEKRHTEKIQKLINDLDDYDVEITTNNNQ